jgi:hypothetical protein
VGYNGHARLDLGHATVEVTLVDGELLITIAGETDSVVPITDTLFETTADWPTSSFEIIPDRRRQSSRSTYRGTIGTHVSADVRAGWRHVRTCRRGAADARRESISSGRLLIPPVGRL